MTKNEALKAIAANFAALSEAVTQLIEEPPKIKLEDVRAVLADISRAGKTAEMKELLSRFGASKLSDIPEDKYPELLTEAKKIADA